MPHELLFAKGTRPFSPLLLFLAFDLPHNLQKKTAVPHPKPYRNKFWPSQPYLSHSKNSSPKDGRFTVPCLRRNKLWQSRPWLPAEQKNFAKRRPFPNQNLHRNKFWLNHHGHFLSKKVSLKDGRFPTKTSAATSSDKAVHDRLPNREPSPIDGRFPTKSSPQQALTKLKMSFFQQKSFAERRPFPNQYLRRRKFWLTQLQSAEQQKNFTSQPVSKNQINPNC